MDFGKNSERRTVKEARFQIRLCENPSCGLRYPLEVGHSFGARCPSCLGTTRVIMTRSIRNEPEVIEDISGAVTMSGLVDNIRSGWNVGSIFRTAEGFNLQHLYLCGITPTPKTVDLSKTALGAESLVNWTYHTNAVLAGEKLKNEGFVLWALEQDPRAIPISSIKIAKGASCNGKGIVIIGGNEESGVDPGLLDICDKILFLPMRGKKRSFNVAVAYGIAIGILTQK